MQEGILAEQLRVARALLGWSRNRLAAAAGVGPRSVARIETGKPSRATVVAAIRSALEYAGVEFTDEPPGARLRTARDA